MEKEKILWKGKPSLLTRILWYGIPIIIIGLVIISLKQILIGTIFIILFLSLTIIDWALTHYIITNKRIIKKTGGILGYKAEIDLKLISSIRITKTILERKTGTGTIGFSTTGQYFEGSGYMPYPIAINFFNINNPEEVKNIIDKYLKKSRKWIYKKKNTGLKENVLDGAGTLQLGRAGS